MSLVRVIAAGVAAATLCMSVPAAGAEPGTATEPALQTVALSGGWARSAPAVAPRNTRRFSLLGVTWADPRAALAGTVEVRTRAVAGGRWTGWRMLESDEPDAADPGTERGATRGSTDPLWVGESDGVEARVVTAGNAGPLPAGLRLDLINPDADPGTGVEARTAIEAPPRPMPKLITRAGWRANETLVKHPPEYTTDVRVVFVHHTATSNGYTCDESASIVRGIAAYHVRSKGWNDIGYNFLVDKCGTLFEGRGGGVDRPVLGAHTLGFNAHSAAIAVIGNHTGAGVPARVRAVIAQVAAYKLGAYEHDPAGRTVLVSNGSDRYPRGTRVALHRISGHRDTGRTECPGDALYAQLGAIRKVAGAGPDGLDYLRITGALKAGSRYFTNSAIRPVWTLRTPSALLDRFDVSVDGEWRASLPPTNRTLPLPLTDGTHTVAVRAVHLSGRSATTTANVVADTTAPEFTVAPAVALRSGSLGSAVPMRVAYHVADAGGLRWLTLTSPVVRDLGATTRSWPGFAEPGVATTWTVRATDWAGNASSAAATRTPVLLTEAGTARTGHWQGLAGAAYLGGRALLSSAAGATMAWTFTGSSAQVTVSRTATSGRLGVNIDSRDYGVLDLRSARRQDRIAIWAPHWPESGAHTLRLTVEGTAGRPGVIVDGLTVLQ